MTINLAGNLVAEAVGLTSDFVKTTDTVPKAAIQADAVDATKVDHDDTLAANGTQLSVENPFTQVDADRLDSLGGEAFTEQYEGTVTAVLNVRDTEAQRTPGQAGVGSFTGDSQLLRVHIDGDSGNLTLVLEGTEADYAGARFRLGGRHVAFDDRQIVSVITPSRLEYEFAGDRSDWLTAGTAEDWAILQPVDPFVSASIDGNTLTLTTESGVSMDVHIPGRPDPITKLPVPLVARKLYNLQTADTIDQSRLSAAVLNSQPTQRNAVFNTDVFNDVRGYSSAYNGIQAATVRGRVVLSFRTAQTSNPPTSLFIGTAIGGLTQHAVNPTVIGNFGHTYLVANTFNYDDLVDGNRYYVNVQFTDGTFLFPPTAVAPGVWLATGPRTLVHAPGYPEEWAERGTDVEIPLDRLPQLPKTKLVTPQASWADEGQPEPISAAATEVINGPGPGVTITSSSANADVAPTLSSPAFDLDDADKQRGEFTAEVIFTLSGRTSNLISFDDQAASQDDAADALTTDDDGFTFVSRVRALSDYDPSQLHGILIGQASIYQSGSRLGQVRVYLGHDSNNVLNYFLRYTGEAGSAGFAIATTLEIDFLHSDPGDAPSGGGGTTSHSVLSPASDVSITVPTIADSVIPSDFRLTPAQWSDWADLASHTVTAGTRVHLLHGQISASLDWPASGFTRGGAGRWYTQSRIVRTRGATDLVVGNDSEYHRGFEIGDDQQAFSMEAIASSTLAANDVVKLQMRVRRQTQGSGVAGNTSALTCTVESDDTKLDVVVLP